MKTENDQYKEKDMGPLFDICSNKHGGNPMSVQANKIASKGKVNTRQRILQLLQDKDWHDCPGMMCEELEQWLKLSHQSCSARLSELRREGKIKIVGERKTRSGSPASIYKATT